MSPRGTVVERELGGIRVSTRSVDRYARAHDASHYLLVPQAVAFPESAEQVAGLLSAARADGRSVTFRSGGTSLSGQAVSGDLLVDTRREFRGIRVGEEGRTVRAEPGATVRAVNARLARHGRKLGPDPASEIACTIGGVIANNSSGMSCGIERNTYRTLESMRVVLASGTVIDTSRADATELLRAREPELHDGLLTLRERLLADADAVARVRHLFSMKNTMGYGVNALLDFDSPLQMLTHLVVGSEGTLGFVAEATFRTVEVLPAVATALLVFPTLRAATAALPALVATGLATIELMDATSLRVAQRAADVPPEIAALAVVEHTALLVEFHAVSASSLEDVQRVHASVFVGLELASPPVFTTDAAARAALWHVRKGLYATVAGARPSGTTALLEDIVVPVDRLLPSCERLVALFDAHGYDDAVIFGHAKDGNLHFMLTERFDDPASVDRYRRFTDDMVDLVLGQGGSLKAEHGTGRVMAPFVRRQYGDELYEIMREIKRLFDPAGVLNPGVILTDDADAYLRDLKTAPTVETEVDRCVECGYCEPTCPSKDVTLTPRQRIVLRRASTAAAARGDDALARELDQDAEYENVQTCAADGMCAIACPVDIDTGDLTRRLRAEREHRVAGAAWNATAEVWGPVTRAGGAALTVARALPTSVARAAAGVGRALLGAEQVPAYDGRLPGGGPARPRAADGVAPEHADAVFFAACVGTMFGPEPATGDRGGDAGGLGGDAGGGRGLGATAAFLRLTDRAGIRLTIPDGLGGLCCGTPWKSKGHLDGYTAMAERVLPALVAASDGGRLPIVCDAASCTEGLATMQRVAAAVSASHPHLRFVDATVFAAERMLPALPPPTRLGSAVVHRTCSTAALGADAALDALARAVADEVVHPVDWGCCAFAGDRGMLHPELTASATAAEAAEVRERDYDAYLSANRTCELGLTRATGRPYRHVLELLEETTR